jgi:hypothetical protein
MRHIDVDFKIDSEPEVKTYRTKPVTKKAVVMHEVFYVETLEGTMQGNPGDYLVQGIHGEYYPCAKDIFEITYEEFEDGEN